MTTPPKPPLTIVLNKNCTVTPILEPATPIITDTTKKSFSITTEITTIALCLEETPGAKSLYHVYRLPRGFEAMDITIGALREEARILAPIVKVYDPKGSVTRAFDNDDFLFRGAHYSVQFRNRPGDAFILIASNPSIVGEVSSNISNTVTSTSYSTGTGAFFTMYSGQETQQQAKFSHTGSILLEARRLSKQ